ncbi:MAG: type V CRISPR-associated protein Cas12b [Opitutales bacterium]
MNRIYQGRVTRVETLLPEKKGKCPEDWEALENWEDKLWGHHQLFQDAVNYYLVALAALADSEHASGNRLVSDLRSRVEAAWEAFPRSGKPGARGLRDSLKEWLRLSENASLEDAFETILEGNKASLESRTLALALLLDRCGGESAIQQGGRGYFPRFCDSKAKPTWDYSTSALRSEKGKTELSAILHGDFSEEDLTKLAAKLELSWTVKLDPDGKLFNQKESTDRIREAVAHISNLTQSQRGTRYDELREAFPDCHSTWHSFLESLPDFSRQPLIPRNRKASKDLTFATILFKYFPCALTARTLALFVKKPSAAKAKPESGQTDFGILGDDPVKLARGERGYFFSAFTALPDWKPLSPGEPMWKEFDIAAFKEALKSLNQFNQKTKEREETEKNLRAHLAIMLGGSVKGWKPKATESGDTEAAPSTLDADLFKLARDLEGELTSDLADTVVGDQISFEFGDTSYSCREGEWRISRSALRGFRDISEDWNKLHRKHGEALSEGELQDVVKAYQQDDKNRKTVGSIPLFLKLCERRFRPLWQEREDDDGEGQSGSFLIAMARFHETSDQWLRAQEPINLTPAEPVHSRRLYMFSDIKDKQAKVVFGKNGDSFVAECAIASRDADNLMKETRVRLHYSGKRLLRDELQGDTESRWVQPMTRALGYAIPEDEFTETLDSALALMPDFIRNGANQNRRFLLNFPVTLDPSWIHRAIGKTAIWKGQFNGIREKNLHLHWPGTIRGKAGEKNPWWQNETVIANGFTCVSVDLGQRSAGAWALLKVTCWDPRERNPNTRRPVRKIGSDGERRWFAEVLTTGILRLPGEDQKVQDGEGRFRRESCGKKGRPALAEEWRSAKKLAQALLADQPEAWVGKFCTEKSFPKQNDALLALANRRLSRLNTFHRWSCFDPDRPDVAGRRDRLIDKLKEELGHWRDPEVADWKGLIETGEFAAFREAAGKGFTQLRHELETHIVALANRVAPLRNRSWKWVRRSESGSGGLYGELLDTGPQLTDTKTWIRGQRGLSLQRIEQLENLRRLFLRYNRSFDREPSEKAKFGRADRGRDSGEPCRPLLDKIDRMKEQRVNQTAHLILAEALGVRLKKHEADPAQRAVRDIHGEYEKIPGRSPVDFVVIENLDRYLTSQGRAPSENSRLMKWAHRAVRDKIKMLAEEPFGIPVSETAAAYSSRFCAITGVAGARCEERPELDDYLRNMLQQRAERPDKFGQPKAADFAALLDQFKQLDSINAEWREARSLGTKANKPPRSLLLPKTGGPLFVGMRSTTQPKQADVNAAVNLGLRAVAAPDALEILHKVQTERTDGHLVPVTRNARERAAFGKSTSVAIALEKEASGKLAKAANPNFFYHADSIARFDRASIKLSEKTASIASGVGLWGSVNENFVARLVAINEQRLRRWLDSQIDEDDVPFDDPEPTSTAPV